MTTAQNQLIQDIGTTMLLNANARGVLIAAVEAASRAAQVVEAATLDLKEREAFFVSENAAGNVDLGSNETTRKARLRECCQPERDALERAQNTLRAANLAVETARLRCDGGKETLEALGHVVQAMHAPAGSLLEWPGLPPAAIAPPVLLPDSPAPAPGQLSAEALADLAKTTGDALEETADDVLRDFERAVPAYERPTLECPDEMPAGVDRDAFEAWRVAQEAKGVTENLTPLEYKRQCDLGIITPPKALVERAPVAPPQGNPAAHVTRPADMPDEVALVKGKAQLLPNPIANGNLAVSVMYVGPRGGTGKQLGGILGVVDGAWQATCKDKDKAARSHTATTWRDALGFILEVNGYELATESPAPATAPESTERSTDAIAAAHARLFTNTLHAGDGRHIYGEAWQRADTCLSLSTNFLKVGEEGAKEMIEAITGAPYDPQAKVDTEALAQRVAAYHLERDGFADLAPEAPAADEPDPDMIDGVDQGVDRASDLNRPLSEKEKAFAVELALGVGVDRARLRQIIQDECDAPDLEMLKLGGYQHLIWRVIPAIGNRQRGYEVDAKDRAVLTRVGDPGVNDQLPRVEGYPVDASPIHGAPALEVHFPDNTPPVDEIGLAGALEDDFALL